PQSIQILLNVSLNDDDQNLRDQVSKVMGRVKPLAGEIWGPLHTALLSPNWTQRRNAAHLIVRLEAPKMPLEVVRTVQSLLSDQAWEVRREAASALSHVKQSEEVAISLVQALNDEVAEVRLVAA